MSRDLRLIVPKNFEVFGRSVNEHLKEIRNVDNDYIIPMDLIRFQNGEGKCVMYESVRDQDVYVMTDIGNYGVTYKVRGKEREMSPDEHYQDLKRIISAMGGHESRLTLIMPLLYQSRQDKRSLRESLDCAMALQELERYNVSEIVTFDAHNPSVANAIPNRMTFSNGYVTSDMLVDILQKETVNFDKLFIVSPDEGARGRAKFLADILGGIPYGHFDKRRDYSNIVDGKNPITYHEFVGKDDLKEYDVIVVDDMIASGQSLLDTAVRLKERGVKHIYLMTTFALFTKGVEEFDKFYRKGYYDRVYSTNLTYVPDEYKMMPWFFSVDCSFKVANVISNLNDGKSVHDLLQGKEEAVQKVRRLRKR